MLPGCSTCRNGTIFIGEGVSLVKDYFRGETGVRGGGLKALCDKGFEGFPRMVIFWSARPFQNQNSGYLRVFGILLTSRAMTSMTEAPNAAGTSTYR